MSALRVVSYKVRGGWEECPCPCGQPLYMGDTAYEVIERGETVTSGLCSRKCAQTEIALCEESDAMWAHESRNGA